MRTRSDELLEQNPDGKTAVLYSTDVDKLYTGELRLTPGTLVINEGSMGVFESQSPSFIKIHWFPHRPEAI